jgi:hypothetical protein
MNLEEWFTSRKYLDARRDLHTAENVYRRLALTLPGDVRVLVLLLFSCLHRI